MMKTHALLGIALAFSTLTSTILPASAEQPLFTSPQISNQTATIPQSTAIAVKFPVETTVDVGRKQDYPITLFLAQPLLDSDGNIVAPTNSPVSAYLKPAEEGGRIVAESVVVGGRVVPIQASSSVIPGNVITVTSGDKKADQNRGVFSRLLGTLAGAVTGGKTESIEQAGLLGAGIGIISGITSPEKVRVVQIPQGSVYVLALQAPVAISFPRQPLENQLFQPPLQTQSPTIQPQREPR
jgi:hypothetical protein